MSKLSSPRNTETPSAIAQIGRLERVTLGERVHTELRELLMSGELAPGQKMSLRSVAETLGVSMMPVREAVARLVADQSLEVLPNRAVRVPLMTRSRFRELTIVRLAVEGFAAEEAARSRTQADLEAMQNYEDAFLAEARSSNPQADRAVRTNKELHFAVYRATGLPTLVGIIEGLWLKIGPVLNFDLKASPERLRTGGATEHHRRLVAAVNVGDGAAARKALIDDIEGAASFIESTGRLQD
ncbi:GntR family transcriptional regulator [Microvirga sp. KLBC 81]|uniref:GntR family transcriptional regulator n=1 Tax=Microvirga sp. KLBC 81 TaxID=1862707 RepID=UPI000D506625|nr:GntR family transcriptional regulator [Microvirga sp. KLBC 81]PVE20729.1 GntR family transcriptional regulator [Microvirga sp. KLBC 81]